MAKSEMAGPEDGQCNFLLAKHRMALLGLAALTLAMFADVLFTTQPVVLSNRDTDLSQQFVHWRTFGFDELRRGNLALWNPHLFSGAPFFGGFQSALLYPPNVLFLVLPLAKAVNFSIALHVFLAGAFTYGWAANRGLRPLAAFLSGAIFMFCGAHFPHIFAGHLPNLCTMVWAPLLFLAIDRLFAKPSVGSCLAGMFAVAMQVLAGHPQYVFYTAVAAAIYSGLCLLKADHRLKIVAGLAAMYGGGAALSAVQLLTGITEARESVRSLGTSFQFAAMFSFPPENLLTLVTPTVFGGLTGVPYWGRCYLWEMSLFVSITGLALAIFGAVTGDRKTRRFSITMAAILFVLALGAHTPLFKVLYNVVPGFDKFRGSSKFIFLLSLFLALLAGIGLDRLLSARQVPRWLMALPLVVGVSLVLVGLWVRTSAADSRPDSTWKRTIARFAGPESYLSPKAYEDAVFQLQAGRHASDTVFVAAGTFLLTAFLLYAGRGSPWLAPGLVGLAVLELFVFARGSLDTFDLNSVDSPAVKNFLAEHPGDYRIMNLINPNSAMSTGALDMWGYDPGVPLRYAQFMAFTQGLNPDEATQYIPFRRGHRWYAMLRCREVFIPGQNGEVRQMDAPDPLPHLQLVQRFRVLTNRNDIFRAMDQASFNPREEVVLESKPEPAPASTSGQGTARVVDSSTDHLTIEASLPSPAILLITDGYSRGWRARGLPGAAQTEYRVMPANYGLRAIPLAAGRHRLRVEYMPAGFVAGKWVSLAAWLGFLGFLMVAIRPWFQSVRKVV